MTVHSHTSGQCYADHAPAPAVASRDALADALRVNWVYAPSASVRFTGLADVLIASGVVEDGDAYLVRRLRELAEDETFPNWLAHEMQAVARDLPDYIESAKPAPARDTHDSSDESRSEKPGTD